MRKTYWRVGTRVQVMQCVCSKKCKHDGATGRIVKVGRVLGRRSPVIQLDDCKRLVWGYECWWVPRRWVTVAAAGATPKEG
jgi:hypothetical protein